MGPIPANPWVVLLVILLVAWTLTAGVFVALGVLRARDEARVPRARDKFATRPHVRPGRPTHRQRVDHA